MLLSPRVMRYVTILLVFAVAACGSSAKKTSQPHPGSARASDQQPLPTASRGDATLSASTGEDLSWLAPVYFAFYSSDIGPEARDTLARLHDWLTRHPGVTITVEGHCDEQGTTEYNVALGQRRAQAIADYLARLGTPSHRVIATTFGSERPAVEGHDEVAWAKNRRGEFRLAR